jgi:hypothetical protein
MSIGPWSMRCALLMITGCVTGCGIQPTGVVNAGRPAGGAQVYFVANGHLQPVARPDTSPDPASAVESLFAGTRQSEGAAGLTTALPAHIRLVESGEDDANRVSLTVSTNPSYLSPLAVLQIACTATRAHRGGPITLTLVGPGASARAAPPCPVIHVPGGPPSPSPGTGSAPG